MYVQNSRTKRHRQTLPLSPFKRKLRCTYESSYTKHFIICQIRHRSTCKFTSGNAVVSRLSDGASTSITTPTPVSGGAGAYTGVGVYGARAYTGVSGKIKTKNSNGS